MKNNKMKKIFLIMLASCFFGGVNSVSVNAQNEFEKIKQSLENFLSTTFSGKLLEMENNEFEETYAAIKRLKNEMSKSGSKLNVDNNLKLKQQNSQKFLSNKSKIEAKNKDEKKKVIKEERVAEITDFLKTFEYDKNFDKTNYMVEGFGVYPFRKGNVKFLYYVHEKTKFQSIIFLTRKGFISIFFSLLPENDKAKAHFLEHLLSTKVLEKQAEKSGYVSHRLLNAQTNEYGFYYLIHKSVFSGDLLKWILEELLKPTFLTDKNLFEAERNRVYHEMKNNEVSKKDESLMFKYLNKYNNGGVSEEILKNTYDEMVEAWKKYIKPNNMLFIGGFGDKPEEIKKYLKIIDEEYLQKAPNNEVVDIKEKLKSEEGNKDLSKDSSIFQVQDWQGNERTDIDYIGCVCFDVKNLSLGEKDALNLWATALESYKELSNKIKEKGYEFSLYDANECLNGEVKIRLYGKKGCNKDKSSLIADVKDILNGVSDYLAEIKEYKHGDMNYLLDLSPLTNKKYRYDGVFNIPDKYRKNYDIYKLFFYSKTKYKTPLSNKVFTIRDGEIVDEKKEIEKNMIENAENVLKVLANQPVKYVSIVKKSDSVKEKPKEELLKETNYKIKGCDGNNNLFRFIEYIIKTKANHYIESLGLSYKGLLKAPYLNGNLMCIAHKKSKEDIDKFLNGDFKEKIRSYDLNKLEFVSKLKSYLENLSREIRKAANFKEMLQSCQKVVVDCIKSDKILCDKYSIFMKLKDNLQDLGIIFDTKEEFLEYRKKVKEFEKDYDYHYGHQHNNKGGLEDEFLQFLLKYINFSIKTIVTVHNNLVALYNSSETIDYDAAKKAIEMNK